MTNSARRVAVGPDGQGNTVVWGIGRTGPQALADAKRELEAQESRTTLTVVYVNGDTANRILNGAIFVSRVGNSHFFFSTASKAAE